MDPAGTAWLEQIYTYLLATGFALARMSGLMLVMPAFTRLGLTALLRSAIALVFVLPLVPMIVAALGGERLAVGLIAALLFKEFVVGLVIGLVLGVPFWAAEAAGDMLDLQRASTSASLLDPLASVEDSIAGTLLVLVLLAIFFASGGLIITLRTLYDSYALWPVRRFLPLFGADAGTLFVHLLDDIISMGLMLVVPIVVCLLLTDLVLALLSRAAPTLHVFDLSLSVKNLVFALLLVLYTGFLVAYLGRDLGFLLSATDRLKAIGGEATP